MPDSDASGPIQPSGEELRLLEETGVPLEPPEPEAVPETAASGSPPRKPPIVATGGEDDSDDDGDGGDNGGGSDDESRRDESGLGSLFDLPEVAEMSAAEPVGAAVGASAAVVALPPEETRPHPVLTGLLVLSIVVLFVALAEVIAAISGASSILAGAFG